MTDAHAHTRALPILETYRSGMKKFFAKKDEEEKADSRDEDEKKGEDENDEGGLK